jgi:uncharacterized protein YdhG (YjbR/CyaY superfamily)
MNIDDYIAGFPEHVQAKLRQMRRAIREAAPAAAEKISYQMPTFHYHGNLVHFAAFKNHVGFYPLPDGMEMFADRLAKYRTGKGSVQFPLDEPLPLALVKEMVKYRAAENLKKEEERRSKKQR